MAMCYRAMQRFAGSPRMASTTAAAAAMAAGPLAVRLQLHSPAPTPRLWSEVGRQYSTTTQAMSEEVAVAADQYNGKPPPVFTSFAVYKTKGAMSVKPLKPRFTFTTNGAAQMDSLGGFIFEVASSSGERRYNWDDKIVVAMNPLELAKIMRAPDQEHSFYHDTFKGQAGREGSVTKSLKWSPAPTGGYYINANSTEKAPSGDRKKAASVSVSAEELYVLKALVDGCMPYFYGFDAAFVSQSP